MPIPIHVILFLIILIILPLAIITIELIRWPRLHKWEKALIILLAVTTLLVSFFAPEILTP